MSEEDDALDFYERNYDLIGQWLLTSGPKIVLGGGDARKCRFCGLEPPEAMFSSEAHAIPQLLGNRTIFTDYECDACNTFFGQGMENHLGNWSKPARTFARIRGKTGVPTLKKGSGGGWRIEPGPAGLEIKDYEDDPVLTVDEVAKTLTFRLKRDTFTPVEVLKAFVKIGISLLPAEELPNFRAAIAWLRQSELQPSLVLRTFPVVRTFHPGPMRDDLIVALLLRRKPTAENVPYVFLVLAYGNEAFQVALPSPEQDASFAGRPVNLYHFPVPTPKTDMPERIGPPSRSTLDLTGREPVKGAELEVVLSFDDVVVNDAQAASG